MKFPLPYIYYEFEYEEDDEGSTEITNYIKANDWKYDKIYDYTDSIEIKQQKEGEYSVVQYGKEPFIIIENIFKRYNGEWYLVKTYDYSD